MLTKTSPTIGSFETFDDVNIHYVMGSLRIPDDVMINDVMNRFLVTISVNGH